MRHRAAVLLLLAGMSVRDLHACAPAPHAGENIAIVEESAVIVWEPSTKTQHFIRRATFKGKARDFGFLVPTPTEPTLAEVSDEIFERLEDGTRRETVYVDRRRIDWTPLLLWTRLKETATGAVDSAVTVLSTKKVAGYEAAVLDASDAGELRQWLTDHGYAASEDLLEWLDAYVQQRWKITAFKIDPEGSEAARTSAVKMSFVTEKPFFPYREPASQRQSYGDVRSLRIWFLGPERVSATIGANGHWPGVLMWSRTPPEAFRNNVARMSGVVLPASTRLTKYVDTSSLRPGTDDLFFARDTDQNEYAPPPYVVENVTRIPIPLDVVLSLAIVLAIVVMVARRRKKAEY